MGATVRKTKIGGIRLTLGVWAINGEESEAARLESLILLFKHLVKLSPVIT